MRLEPAQEPENGTSDSKGHYGSSSCSWSTSGLSTGLLHQGQRNWGWECDAVIGLSQYRRVWRGFGCGRECVCVCV